MEKGDLIIVTEDLPDWDWLEYTTGSIGVITKVRPSGNGFDLLEVFFFHTEINRVIPVNFVRLLGKSDE